MRDSGDGAGHDEADTGTKNITREHEMALAANARATLEQTEHALERLDTGTYGLCEVCGKPIGKARMQAFPRATLCVEDKQKQERRADPPPPRQAAAAVRDPSGAVRVCRTLVTVRHLG